jgi:hypothetical protein
MVIPRASPASRLSRTQSRADGEDTSDYVFTRVCKHVMVPLLYGCSDFDDMCRRPPYNDITCLQNVLKRANVPAGHLVLLAV